MSKERQLINPEAQYPDEESKQVGFRGTLNSEVFTPVTLNAQFLALQEVSVDRIVSGSIISRAFLKGKPEATFRPPIRNLSEGELVRKRNIGAELVKKIIDYPNRKLVIFVGEGGTGKTTIAGQYAQELEKIDPSIEVVRLFFDGICAEYVKRFGPLGEWSKETWSDMFGQLIIRNDLLIYAAQKHNLMIKFYQQAHGPVSQWNENIWSSFAEEIHTLQKNENLLKEPGSSQSWLLTHKEDKRYLVFLEMPVLGQYRDFLSLLDHYSSIANEKGPEDSPVTFLAIAPNFRVQDHAAEIRDQVFQFPKGASGLKSWLLKEHKINLGSFTDSPEDTKKIKQIFRRMAKGEYISRIRAETLRDAYYIKSTKREVFMHYLDNVGLPDELKSFSVEKNEEMKVAASFMLWLFYDYFGLSSEVCNIVFNNLSEEIVNYLI